MSFQQKIIRFSVGKFSNGVYTVFGIVWSGILYGFIIKSSLKSIKIFSYVTLSQYDSKSNVYPDFRKIYGFFGKKQLKYFDFNSSLTHVAIYFLSEISNLPLCSLKYREYLMNGKRDVMIEKYSTKDIVRQYYRFDKITEMNLVTFLKTKYGKPFILGVHLIKPVCLNDFWDRDRNNCVVDMPTFFNDKIFLTLNQPELMDRLYNVYVEINQKKLGVNKQIEELQKKTL